MTSEEQNLAAAMLRAGFDVKHTVDAIEALAEVLDKDLVINKNQVESFRDAAFKAVTEYTGT